MPVLKIKFTKVIKPILSSVAVLGVVGGGFIVTQKNDLKTNPYKESAQAVACVGSFSDNFAGRTKILSGSEINTTVGGENYTTDGTLTSTTMITPGNPGVRLRNFFDPMRPNERPDGYDYSKVWNIYLPQNFEGDITDGADNAAKDALGSRKPITSGNPSTVIGYNTYNPTPLQISQIPYSVIENLNAIGQNEFKNNPNSQVAYQRGDNSRGLVLGGVVTGYKKGLYQVTHPFPANTFNSGNFVMKVKYQNAFDAVPTRSKQILSIMINGSSTKNPYTNLKDGGSYSGSYGLVHEMYLRNGAYSWNPNLKIDTNTSANTYAVVKNADTSYPYDLSPQNNTVRDFTFKYLTNSNNSGSGTLSVGEGASVPATIPGAVTNWEKVTGITFTAMHFNDYSKDPIALEAKYSDVRIDWSKTGQIDSVDIDKPASGFQAFTSGASIPVGTTVTYQVINSATGVVFLDNVASGTSLSGAPSKIRLRAIINRNSVYTQTPTLQFWSVGCGSNVTPTPITLTPTPTPVLACINMYWPGGGKALSMNAGDVVSLTLNTNVSAPLSRVTYAFTDVANTISWADNSFVFGTTSQLQVRYSDFSSKAYPKTQFQIRATLSNGSTSAACVVTVNINYPPIVNMSAGGTSIGCSTAVKDPYKLRFTINTKSLGNSVTLNKAYLLPRNSPAASIPAGYSNTQSTPSIILGTNSQNAGLPFGATYSGSFSPGPNATWTFTLDFDKYMYTNGNGVFFDKSGGFDLYLMIQDLTGNNLVSGNVQKMTLSPNIDPFQDCTNLFYKTSGGDVRSNEGKFYNDNSSYVTDSQSANKLWRVVKQDSNYSSDKNKNSDLNQSLSSFSAELFPFQSCDSNLSSFSASTNGNFCPSITKSSGITHDIVMQDFADNLNAAVDILKTFNKANVGTNTMTPSSLAYPSSALQFFGGNTLNIDVSQIPAALSPLVITITNPAITNVVIKDNVTDVPVPSIKDLVIWCSTPSCTMRLTSVATFPTNQISLNSPSNKLKYPTTPAINSFVTDKGRIYFNFGSSSEVPTIPSTTSPLAILVAQGTLTPKQIPNPRRIILDSANNFSNMYLGGFMTNGYFYSDQSKGTNVVKGFVVSRGIAVRESVDGATNNDTNRNKLISFKDFTNPFLYIDYDAKYMFNYRALFSKAAKDVQRDYVGL